MHWSDRIYLQDAIEARRDSLEETKKEVKRNANAKINWSYEPTREVCFRSAGGALPHSQAEAAANRLKLEVARENNLAAIKLLAPYFSSMAGQFYQVPREQFRFAPDIAFPVRMLGLLHDGLAGVLYWVQFRKNLHELLDRLSIVAAAIRINYLEDPEYRGFDFKILDVSAGVGGKRKLRIFSEEDIPKVSDEYIADFLDPVVRAVRELRAERFEPEKRKKRPRPRGDERTLDLL